MQVYHRNYPIDTFNWHYKLIGRGFATLYLVGYGCAFLQQYAYIQACPPGVANSCKGE